MFFAAALPVLAAVGGCVSLSPTTELAPPSEATFRNAEAFGARTIVSTSATAADQTLWWRRFGDPDLTRLVETALMSNLDVAQAEARLAEANALVGRARADRLPSGGANASVARQRQSLEGPIGQFASNAPGYTRDGTVFETGVQASWEPDLFGRLGASAQAARASQSETAALLDGVRIRIAAETADAWLSFAGANEQILLIEQQCEVLRRLTSTVSRRFEVSEAGLGELEQARADLARMEALLALMSIEAEVQRNRITVLTGGDDVIDIPDRLPVAPLFGVTGTPASVLRQRPDVRAAEARVMASDARVGAALAEYYPSVSIAGLAGFQALDADLLFNGSAVNAQALVGLRWRLFDFTRIDAEVAAARARGDGAIFAYRAALLVASEDVENALFSLVAREQEAADLARTVGSLEAVSQASQRTYDAGLIGLPELLDVERRLLAARQEDVFARLGVARSAVAVFRATGEGIGEKTSAHPAVPNTKSRPTMLPG